MRRNVYILSVVVRERLLSHHGHFCAVVHCAASHEFGGFVPPKGNENQIDV